MTKINPGIELHLDIIKDSGPQIHSYIEIIYVLEGEIIFSIANDKLTLYKDDIIVLSPGKPHYKKSNNDALICKIMISPDLFSELSGDNLPAFWCNTAIIENEKDAGLRALLNKILRHHLVKGQNIDLFQISQYYQLADYLSSNYLLSSEDISQNQGTGYSGEYTYKALLYIHANYTQPLTLLELAKHLSLTGSYLSRYLKKNLGINFKEYLTKIRLNHAVNDLLYSKKSILRIAIDNGFANLAMFNKAFRAAYNTTPTEYKKSMKSIVDERAKKRAALERQILEKLEHTMGEAKNEDINDKKIVEATECLSNGIFMKKPWSSMINVGAVVDVLNSDIQKHIIQLKQKLDFKYVRFWGIFPETLTKRYGNEIRFNFSRIDHVINFLAQNELKPFFQLGPKLRTIIDTVGGQSLYAADIVDPNEYDNEHWGKYLDMLMRHLVTKFGVSEVESWIFEMWNPSPWDSPWENWYSDEKYEAFYRTVKKYAPRALVGGCEYERHIHSEVLKKSAMYWKAHDIIPDFVSFQFFPYIVKKENMSSSIMLITEADYLQREARNMRRTLDSLELNGTKLYISLWNMTISNRNILNDTCFKGAWIMKNMLDITDIVDVVGYWLASDVYGETYDSNSILFGGAGIITKNSIYKPAFHAFEFMKKAMEVLVVKRENYVITKDSSGNYLVLFHNMKTMNIHSLQQKGESIRFNDLEQIFESNGTLKLCLTLQGVEPGNYYIRKSSVSREHGSVLDESNRWSQNVSLRHDDYDYLQRICIPHIDINHQETKDNRLLLELDIISNEFGMVEIFKQF